MFNSLLYREVPYWVAKILKRKGIDYPGSMVYDQNGNLMWIGGFRRKMNMIEDEKYTSAPTWKWLIDYALR